MRQVLSHRFLKPDGGLLADGAAEVSIAWSDVDVDLSDATGALGTGAGGTVFVGRWQGHEVAVKKVQAGQEQEALAESRTARLLHAPAPHKNVLMIHGTSLRAGTINPASSQKSGTHSSGRSASTHSFGPRMPSAK